MEWLNYLLKVTACTGVFYLLFRLFLQRLTFFSFNRYYLLGSLLLSFVIPLIQVEVEGVASIMAVRSDIAVIANVTNPQLEEALLPISQEVQESQVSVEGYSWIHLLELGYWTISTALLLMFLIQAMVLLRAALKFSKRMGRLKIIYKSEGFTNCSFFNYVFVDDCNLSEAEVKVLLQHEAVHFKRYHSVDKLFINFCKVLMWFNPIIYLYGRSLELVHEYEADETASSSFGNTAYASLLLRMATEQGRFVVAHSFAMVPIKERIKMLFTNQSGNMKKLMYLLVLPIGLGLIWLFAIQIVYAAPNSKIDDKPFTLILDAGHGGLNKGAEIGGINEKDVALAIVDKVRIIAEIKGIRVVTTRDKDVDMTLQDRVKLKGDFFLSLHVNEFPSDAKKNGIDILIDEIREGDKVRAIKSGRMAHSLYKNLKNLNGIYTNNKTLYNKGLFILKNSLCPSAILELGFLTNKNDKDFITNTQKQNELANAIVESVLQYKTGLQSDEEITIMQNEADKLSNIYKEWLNSEKYRDLTREVVKIKTRTISGKIEKLHYFGVQKKLDGFILDADGKKYRVYIHPTEMVKLKLNPGDSFVIKVGKAEVWFDSDYPVIIYDKDAKMLGEYYRPVDKSKD